MTSLSEVLPSSHMGANEGPEERLNISLSRSEGRTVLCSTVEMTP